MLEAVNTKDDIKTSTKRSSEMCAFWLPKKKRYCLTKPVAGWEYCQSHHLKATEVETLRIAKNVQPSSSGEINNLVPEVLGRLATSNLTHEAEPPFEITVYSTKEQLSGTVEAQRPPPIPNQCHFYMERKKRYCKARTSNVHMFCVEHSVSSESSRARIPCPKDPKHSCYKDQLEKHLRKCNARHELRPIYFEDGINAGELEEGEAEDFKIGIHDIDVSELNNIIELVKTLHHEHVSITTSELSHDVLKDEVSKSSNGVVALKHLYQQSSLVGNLESLGLLKDNCTYLEFGAGKGGLSHWIQLANKANPNTRYILIDRSSVRYKMDSFHKGDDQGPNFERMKIDIENLDLTKVSSLCETCGPVVGTGKHLCGAATDLMLRCLMNMASSNVSCPVDGIVVALCCHHRCEWKSYVGKKWFKEHGLGKRHFSLITSMSAWATCGTRPAAGTKSLDENNESHQQLANPSDYNHPRYGKLLPEERESIGIQCKQVIDAGRLHYLMADGFDAKLLYYIDRSLTLENTALTAVRCLRNPAEHSFISSNSQQEVSQ